MSLCHKWVLTSFDCVGHSFAVRTGAPAQATATLDTGVLGGDSGPFARPVRFSLSNAGASVLDIEAVSLTAPDGRPLLVNGGFDAGADRWSFTADDHASWHVENLALTLLLETGLLGAACAAALLALALWRGVPAVWAGDLRAAAPVAAVAGLVAVGALSTVIDAPRFLLLFVLLCGLAATVQRQRPGARRGRLGDSP